MQVGKTSNCNVIIIDILDLEIPFLGVIIGEKRLVSLAMIGRLVRVYFCGKIMLSMIKTRK